MMNWETVQSNLRGVGGGVSVFWRFGWRLQLPSLLCLPADQRAHQHLHDPDRGSGQPPERPGHAHAADQGLHAGGGELHRQVPTMHHGGLHDVPHHQVIPGGAGPGAAPAGTVLKNLCAKLRGWRGKSGSAGPERDVSHQQTFSRQNIQLYVETAAVWTLDMWNSPFLM